MTMGTTDSSTIPTRMTSMFWWTKSTFPSAAPSSVTPAPHSTPPRTLKITNVR